MQLMRNRLIAPPVHAGLVAASLAGMHAGGRFVELAKRDIWSSARVAQERADVAYTLLAVDFLPAAVSRNNLQAIRLQVRSRTHKEHQSRKLSLVGSGQHSMGEV